MARKKPNKNISEVKANKEVEKKEPSFLSNLDWSIVGLIAVLLVTLIIRLKFLNIPFERDEGTYAYFGQLVLDGKIPYVDFYEMKFPGIYYCYALIVGIFGATLKGIHIGMLMVNLLSIYFIYRASSIWFNKTVGVVTALSFSFLSMTPHASGFSTQSEHWVSFFTTAGLLVMLNGIKKDNYKLYFISGILFCCSLLVKQNGAFFMLFGGLYLTTHYLLNKNLDWKNAFLSGLVFTVGAVLAIVITSSIIAAQGAWDQFVYWVYTYPQLYVGGIEWEPQGKQLLNIAYSNISTNTMAFIYFCFAGLITVFFTKQNLHKKLMLLLFFLLSFGAISPGLRFYGHYWLYLMPAVALCIGGMVYSINDLLCKYSKSRYIKFVGVGVFIIGFAHHWVAQGNDPRIKDYYTNPDETNILRSVYGQNPFPESKVIGDLIKSNSKPDDKIAIFGSEPQIFIYSGLRGISRHNYVSYLVDKTEESAVYQQEFIKDVETNRPKFLVYFRHPVSWLTQPVADKTIFSWFDKFANDGYQLVGLTQVLGPNNLFYKWGNQEAMAALQDFRKQEQGMRNKIQELQKNAAANQQQIANIQNQLQLFNFEIIVFERKDS